MSGGPDVVVVGAGVAGLAAAIAARRAGAEVWLVEGPGGASALAGGAWDLATDRREKRPLVAAARTIEDAIDDFDRERPGHPLARLPRDEVIRAVTASHRAVLGRLAIYRPLGVHADAEIVVGDLGLPRRAALAQHTVLDLARIPGARIAVAWMRALRSFDGRFIAASLNEQAVRSGDRRRFAAVEIEFLRRTTDTLMHPHEAAALLDQEDARARAAAALVRGVGGMGFEALLVPPVLGLNDLGVQHALETAVGIPVGESVEALAGAQSVRLARRISDALDAEGVVRRRARALRVTVDAEGPAVELEIGESLYPGALVLATGKLVGGGIVLAGGEPREPLAGLPIWSGGKPLGPSSNTRGRDFASLFGDNPFEPGAGFALGVGFDAELRPLDAHGRIVSRNLFACGALLEGVSEGDGTGLGTAVTTGWLAGTRAAARAGR